MSTLALSKRLTLMFVTIATTVLLGLGAVVAQSVQQHFEDLDMEVLTGKVELISQAVQGMTQAQDLTGLAHQLARSLVGHHGLEVMLLDTDQTLLFATAHAQFEPQQVVALASQSPQKPVLWTVHNQTYRVLATQIPTMLNDAQGQPTQVLVATAIDIGHHQVFMRTFLHTLWWFVAAAALATALLSGWAVRRSLAPLRAMRTHAQGVTVQQLNLRLDVQQLPIELAELAHAMNDMLARLEEAFKRLSDFSSDMAHELRTPVSNLMMQTQVALSRNRSAADYRQVLESNAEEFERMARMISDMLLLAKADHGLVLPQLAKLDMAHEVRAVLDYFELLADEKNLRLQVQGAATLSADPLMLRRALSNLVSNAVRHAYMGTVIRVKLNNLAEQLEITVTNQGETIAPEHLTRVFDRFFRADSARQHDSEQRSEGTGLGLAITQSIVIAHGGSISVRSEQGVTTFTLRLPQRIFHFH